MKSCLIIPFVLEDDYDDEKFEKEISLLEGRFTREDVKYLYDHSRGAERACMKKWLDSFPVCKSETWENNKIE